MIPQYPATRSIYAPFNHQRAIAVLCLWVQTGLAIFFSACWLLASEANELAVLGGYIAILGALAPVGYALSKGRLPLLFNTLSIFNLAPIWFLYLETVIPGYDAYEYTPASYRIQAFFWIAAFMFFVNAGYLLLLKPLSRVGVRSFAFLPQLRLGVNGYFLLTLFSVAFPLAAFAAYYGSPGVLWAAISGGRAGGGSAGGLLLQDSVGDSSSLMLPINWLFQIAPCLGTIAFLKAPNKLSIRSVGSLLLSFLVVFVFFLSGSRGVTMYVAAPLLFAFVYYNYSRGLKFWVIVLLIFLGAISVMELQVRFRGNLLEVLADPAAAARKRGLRAATTLDVTESQRDNNTYLFSLILKGYPDKYPYEGFNNFVAVVVNPVPRAFWPGKPILIGAKDISQQDGFVLDGPLYMGTTSLSYSVVGEAYKSRGLWGILIYAVPYAIFMVCFDALSYYEREEGKEAVVGLMGMSIFLSFWGFRSFFAFVTFLYPLLTILLIFYCVFTYRRLVKA